MTEHWDSGDLDAIRELLESPGWKIVAGRLQEQIERERNELEKPGSNTDLVRGCIQGLRIATSVPEILEQEMAKAVKEVSQ